MEIEYRKAFDDYIRDCQKPEKKKAAEQVRDQINTRRKYKAEILDNPSGMKLESGKVYKAEQLKPAADQKKRQPGKANRTDEEQKIRIALQRNEIHHLCHKDDPDYDDSEYHNRKAGLIIQLATLKSGRQLQRSDDGRLIEYRAISFTNKGEQK